jgi:hypothetical protein
MCLSAEAEDSPFIIHVRTAQSIGLTADGAERFGRAHAISVAYDLQFENRA